MQTTIDGTNWVDIVHFNTLLGNGGPKRYFAATNAYLGQASYEIGSALLAGNIRNVFGDQYRAKWAVVDGGAHGQSFTFSVSANFK